jgi:hypothetical protein
MCHRIIHTACSQLELQVDSGLSLKSSIMHMSLAAWAGPAPRRRRHAARVSPRRPGSSRLHGGHGPPACGPRRRGAAAGFRVSASAASLPVMTECESLSLSAGGVPAGHGHPAAAPGPALAGGVRVTVTVRRRVNYVVYYRTGTVLVPWPRSRSDWHRGSGSLAAGWHWHSGAGLRGTGRGSLVTVTPGPPPRQGPPAVCREPSLFSAGMSVRRFGLHIEVERLQAPRPLCRNYRRRCHSSTSPGRRTRQGTNLRVTGGAVTIEGSLSRVARRNARKSDCYCGECSTS